MATFNWKTSVPSTPDASYVVVDNISLSATEDTVRDFFAFCGPIESLELQKQESGTQRALVKFNGAEAAKTAILLSNAHINYEPITVTPLFPEASPSTPPPSGPASHDTTERQSSPIADANANYEGKPALYVVHELLAAGYLVGKHVVNRASEFDAKYRVTNRTQEQARSLDSQYKFSNYLQQWDDKFNVTKRAMDAYNKVQSHPVGQKVILTVNEAYQSALQLSQDARDIAERKRAHDEKLFGKFPLPSDPDAGSSTSGSNKNSNSNSDTPPNYEKSGPSSSGN
ncbi:Protein vip1 [Kickxella alabastrina]|nr:Protein vip1 [Kickxella alabastrina]